MIILPPEYKHFVIVQTLMTNRGDGVVWLEELKSCTSNEESEVHMFESEELDTVKESRFVSGVRHQRKKS